MNQLKKLNFFSLLQILSCTKLTQLSDKGAWFVGNTKDLQVYLAELEFDDCKYVSYEDYLINKVNITLGVGIKKYCLELHLLNEINNHGFFMSQNTVNTHFFTKLRHPELFPYRIFSMFSLYRLLFRIWLIVTNSCLANW